MKLHPEDRRQTLKAAARVGLALAILLSVPLGGSCYLTRMPGESFSGPLPALDESQRTIEANLRTHVETLSVTIGERHVGRRQALRAAERYITRTLTEAGYPAEAVLTQPYKVNSVEVRNLEVEVKGTDVPDEIVIIGAHYDSVPDCPAANDNASGTAAVLELARLMKQPARRTIRFVFFVNEEPPFFQNEGMGSREYARRSRERGENIVAMYSFDTVGYYSDAPGSQDYPPPFSWFYPDEANFIGFVGNSESRPLVHRTIELFRKRATFPSEGLAAPGWITGVDFSDHWSFWQEGYPGVMISDTAFFRYAHYHLASDTPDRVDTERLALIVSGLAEVFREIADAPSD